VTCHCVTGEARDNFSPFPALNAIARKLKGLHFTRVIGVSILIVSIFRHNSRFKWSLIAKREIRRSMECSWVVLMFKAIVADPAIFEPYFVLRAQEGFHGSCLGGVI